MTEKKPVIICVDDEANILNSLRSELENIISNDFLIEIAQSGEEALELVEQLLEDAYQISVVISDYIMPNMKGDELLKEVHKLSPQTLKIMLTGQADIDAVGRAIQYAKLYRYIAKPWQSEDLRLTVIEAVNSYLQEQKIFKQNRECQILNKQLENSLDLIAANERKFRAIFNQTFQLTWILDRQGNLIEVNQTALDFGGIELNDVIGKLFWECYWWTISKETQTQLQAAFQEACQGKFIRYEVDILRVNQTTATIDFSMKPIFDGQGKIEHFIVEGRDISQQKEAQKAQIRAELADQAKSEFLARMSHEIRTPMNGILGMAELLAISELDQQQQEFVNLIQQSGENLLYLINNILDFSKLESNKVNLDFDQFELSTFIKEIISILLYDANHRNIKLQYNIAEKIPNKYLGDSFRLKQILVNLINNAIKFTEQGTVTLTVKKYPNSQPNYYNFKNPITLYFSIQDTGIGIKQEDQNKLFKSFSQVEDSTTRKYGGTGLGLSICKQLVELMGGEIGVESIAGKGSNFWFTAIFDHLDSGSDEHENDDEKNLSSTTKSSLNAEKILVVEDNSVNQKVIENQMKQLGHKIDIANNGQEALEMLKYSDYQIILMDCQMPVLDGYETTKKIRQIEAIKDIKIIGLSAFAMKGDPEKCLEAGMNDYLSKPVKIQELKTMLNKWGHQMYT